MALSDRVFGLILRFDRGSTHAASLRTGIPFATLWRIVSGKVQQPRVDAVQKLARAYRVKVYWLLTGLGPKRDGQKPEASPCPTCGHRRPV